ncbi:MAG: hypothetical protein PHT96_05520 [Syntrophorhabdaceae bacterium]|nr:hypothetical protein [Syntrophorhabdaceae bacterium]
MANSLTPDAVAQVIDLFAEKGTPLSKDQESLVVGLLVDQKADPQSAKPKTAQVMEVFEEHPGVWFSTWEIRDRTGLPADDIRNILRKKKEAAIIISDGKKYKLAPASRIVNPFKIMANSYSIEFPLNIHGHAIISVGDVVIISGWKNCGKTAFLMDVGIINAKRGLTVNYIVTENVQKIGRRYLQWGYTQEEILERITFRDCRDRDYTSIIEPDSLNILDYYNPASGEYHKTAAEIEGMARQLKNGVLVLGIQHARGQAMPRGGELSQELSQLTVLLSEVEAIRTGEMDSRKVGKAKILTIKEPGTIKGGEGKVCQYEVTQHGGRLAQVDSWDYPRKS